MSFGIRPDQCDNYEPDYPEAMDGQANHVGPPPQRWIDLPFTPRVRMDALPVGLACEVDAAFMAQELVDLLQEWPYLVPVPRRRLPHQTASLEVHHYLAVRAGLILRLRVSYCENTDAYHFHYNNGFHPDVEVLL